MVIMNRTEYKARTIGKLVIGWLRRAGKYQRELAAVLGISQQALSQKCMNNSFTYADLIIIFYFLDVPDDEILKTMKILRKENS